MIMHSMAYQYFVDLSIKSDFFEILDRNELTIKVTGKSDKSYDESYVIRPVRDLPLFYYGGSTKAQLV